MDFRQLLTDFLPLFCMVLAHFVLSWSISGNMTLQKICNHLKVAHSPTLDKKGAEFIFHFSSFSSRTALVSAEKRSPLSKFADQFPSTHSTVHKPANSTICYTISAGSRIKNSCERSNFTKNAYVLVYVLIPALKHEFLGQWERSIFDLFAD